MKYEIIKTEIGNFFGFVRRHPQVCAQGESVGDVRKRIKKNLDIFRKHKSK
jgi:predicted RNase H-like HicB family nuclease